MKTTASMTIDPDVKLEMTNFAHDLRISFSALVEQALKEFKANNKGKK